MNASQPDLPSGLRPSSSWTTRTRRACCFCRPLIESQIRRRRPCPGRRPSRSRTTRCRSADQTRAGADVHAEPLPFMCRKDGAWAFLRSWCWCRWSGHCGCNPSLIEKRLKLPRGCKALAPRRGPFAACFPRDYSWRQFGDDRGRLTNTSEVKKLAVAHGNRIPENRFHQPRDDARQSLIREEIRLVSTRSALDGTRHCSPRFVRVGGEIGETPEASRGRRHGMTSGEMIICPASTIRLDLPSSGCANPSSVATASFVRRPIPWGHASPPAAGLRERETGGTASSA